MKESVGKLRSGKKSDTRSELCDERSTPSKPGEGASELVSTAAALWKFSGEEGL